MHAGEGSGFSRESKLTLFSLDSSRSLDLFFYSQYFFFAALGLQSRASSTLGKHSPTGGHQPDICILAVYSCSLCVYWNNWCAHTGPSRLNVPFYPPVISYAYSLPFETFLLDLYLCVSYSDNTFINLRSFSSLLLSLLSRIHHR